MLMKSKNDSERRNEESSKTGKTHIHYNVKIAAVVFITGSDLVLRISVFGISESLNMIAQGEKNGLNVLLSFSPGWEMCIKHVALILVIKRP